MIRLSAFEKWLAAFAAFIISMLVCRWLYSETRAYVFLLWNLFLAWIPFQISLSLKPNISKTKSVILIGVWLLFFPNALYIITDLIHLEQRQNIPVWYDAVLLFTVSLVGLIMAMASLYNIEIFLRSKIRQLFVNGAICFCLFAGSFGVYLGRFLRWNSWDIVADPFQLLKEIAVRFLYPFEHYRTWGVTLLLTCLFSLLYYGSKLFQTYQKTVK
jgi:uncharacterized membrane protein